MTPTLILACALLAADSAASQVPSGLDHQAYQAERAKAGRDPDANVRLALWCEARGLDSERLRHLSLAVLANPSHATARALLGMVSEGGRWGRPESIAERAQADLARSTLRAEYEARRSKTLPTADDQWKLARWCEQVGLVDQATAHDTAVVRLDPSREAAWKKLGCRKFEGRWMTPDQIDALKADRVARAQAERKWTPILQPWKEGLDRPSRRAESESGLLGLADPGAVRSIWKVFATGGPKDQARAVRLFGQVDSPDATDALVALAVCGQADEVRRPAIETLRGRDVRGSLDPVILLLRDPIKFAFKPIEGPDSPGRLAIEGKDANFERIYPAITLNPALNLNSPRNQALLPRLISDSFERANRLFAEDVGLLVATNLGIEAANRNALAVLTGVTGKDFGLDQVKWLAWWTDQKGYAFQAPPPNNQTAEKPTITQIVSPGYASTSCFAAGTMVQTVDGPKPIEEVRPGDRLLTQDTTSGALGYQPALAVAHNPPAETLRLRIGGEDVVATGIHRFWKVGQGWAMARELKVGDAIRRIGGIARVESVEADRRQPVFNIEVAKGSDFFVGRLGVLVHDNSLVHAVARPFDAAPASDEASKTRAH